MAKSFTVHVFSIRDRFSEAHHSRSANVPNRSRAATEVALKIKRQKTNRSWNHGLNHIYWDIHGYPVYVYIYITKDYETMHSLNHIQIRLWSLCLTCVKPSMFPCGSFPCWRWRLPSATTAACCSASSFSATRWSISMGQKGEVLGKNYGKARNLWRFTWVKLT